MGNCCPPSCFRERSAEPHDCCNNAPVTLMELAQDPSPCTFCGTWLTAGMKHCGSCGKANPDFRKDLTRDSHGGGLRCVDPTCGKFINSSMMYCSSCGCINPFCPTNSRAAHQVREISRMPVNWKPTLENVVHVWNMSWAHRPKETPRASLQPPQEIAEESASSCGSQVSSGCGSFSDFVKVPCRTERRSAQPLIAPIAFHDKPWLEPGDRG